MPIDASDPIDLVIIYVHKNNQSGLFVFNKKILLEKKIFRFNNQGGKRAIRIYPPWDQAHNRQAQATQHWQLKYFFEFGSDIKLTIAKKLNYYLLTIRETLIASVSQPEIKQRPPKGVKTPKKRTLVATSKNKEPQNKKIPTKKNQPASLIPKFSTRICSKPRLISAIA